MTLFFSNRTIIGRFEKKRGHFGKIFPIFWENDKFFSLFFPVHVHLQSSMFNMTCYYSAWHRNVAILLSGATRHLLPPFLPSSLSFLPSSLPFFQEMVSVESFIELVKKRDIGRLKFAIRETNFNIDRRDEVPIPKTNRNKGRPPNNPTPPPLLNFRFYFGLNKISEVEYN